MEKHMLVRPGSKVNLDDHDPDFHGGLDKDDADVERRRDQALERTCELQEALFAEARQSLLVVLQAMDTGGKDGVINHVMRGLNPQGVHVRSFKVPTPEELAHDFLWRVHQRVPARGNITVFNRSHYEDVLVVRVHELVPENMWRKRYEQINEFEQLLAENGTRILKLFLY
ncbi:MAG TPA: polyphosphate--AMP phosphotransferase, partial [Armatimonadetes bacterium]|nr:polyphosphate--AMP phosphotransferase [Armatimonadota bacterium]